MMIKRKLGQIPRNFNTILTNNAGCDFKALRPHHDRMMWISSNKNGHPREYPSLSLLSVKNFDLGK